MVSRCPCQKTSNDLEECWDSNTPLELTEPSNSRDQRFKSLGLTSSDCPSSEKRNTSKRNEYHIDCRTHCTDNDKCDYEGGPGEIIVKIYRTEIQEKRPRAEGGGGGGDRGPRTPKEHNDPEFQPFGFNDDKNALD